MTFGELLYDTRRERQITLRQLAKEVELTPSYISDIERGARRAPTTDTVIRLALALSADPRELLEQALVERTSMEFSIDDSATLKKREALLTLARLWDDLDDELAAKLTEFLEGQARSNG